MKDEDGNKQSRSPSNEPLENLMKIHRNEAIHLLRQLPEGIQEIGITNILEDLAISLFPPEKVFSFYQLCF